MIFGCFFEEKSIYKVSACFIERFTNSKNPSTNLLLKAYRKLPVTPKIVPKATCDAGNYPKAACDTTNCLKAA
jgi:hypothetical protein